MSSRIEELASLVATARTATEDLVDDPILRQIAFKQVLAHLLAGGTPAAATIVNRQGIAPDSAPTTYEADGAFASEQQRADALAHYFKTTPENIHHIFSLSEVEPTLVLPSSRLAESKAVATREIALLLAGARTALGQETTTTQIREVADHFAKLDARNFMASLGQLSELSVLGKPRSPNRIVRMRATGAEAAQALAERISSE